MSPVSARGEDELIIRAAQMAGVHEMIQNLPNGYNTQIGEGGQALSGGQRQRIGLARALYGMPALIVLDEPNASLDAAGEQALMDAVRRLKEAGRTVILITHKTNSLALCDLILLMKDGTVQAFGPRDEVLQRLMKPHVVHSAASGTAPAPQAAAAAGGAAGPVAPVQAQFQPNGQFSARMGHAGPVAAPATPRMTSSEA